MSKCTLSQAEWQAMADAIQVIDNLMEDAETTVLGCALLADTRARVIMRCLGEVEKCDRLNEHNPIPQKECPIYTILQERLKREQAKRGYRRDPDDIVDLSGPDGFYE